MKLYELAHSRAGDKGNTLTLSLIPYNESDYNMLCVKATAERVKEHLKDIVSGEIIRYELPNIASLLFVCQNALMGGVTTSLAMDTHGKTLSYALLKWTFNRIRTLLSSPSSFTCDVKNVFDKIKADGIFRVQRTTGKSELNCL